MISKSLRVALRIGPVFVAAFFVIAALLKLSDLQSFMDDIKQWTVIPRSLVPLLVVGVPVLEVSVAGWWLLTHRRLLPCITLITLLVTFSAGYLIQAASGHRPPCGCLGVIGRNVRADRSATVLVTRNSIMALVLLGGLFVQAPLGRRGRSSETQPPVPSGHRAFTVIELLIVIAVLSSLVALAMPSLARGRHSARGVSTTSNLRSLSMAMASYHSDWKDLYPVLTDPKATISIIRCESAGVAVRAVYFDASLYWNVGLADQYFQGAWSSRAYGSAWDRGGPRVAATLQWGCSFVADPDYYVPRARRPPPAQLRPVRASEVLFPSAKGLATAAVPWELFGEVYSSMVDGHAGQFQQKDLNGDISSADGAFIAYSYHPRADKPMTHTLHGVRGRDLR
ncbi:MAG: type II secretion system protein [Phycisphaerales bacterium]